jgi:hypothetical protein
VVDPVDLIFLPIGSDLAHHVLATLGVLSKRLLDDDPALAVNVVVLLEHLRDLDKRGWREGELHVEEKPPMMKVSFDARVGG